MGAAGRAVKEESVKRMNKVTPIDAEMLTRFEQGYAARPELQVMSNAISRTALPDAAFVPAAAARLQMDFSVLVQTSNITNQKQSGRCWMFSTLNVLRWTTARPSPCWETRCPMAVSGIWRSASSKSTASCPPG